MPATNLFMSYVDATFTPEGGSAIDLTEITDVNWDLSGDPEEWYADGSNFPKLALTPKNNRRVRLTGGDVRKLLTLPQRTVGTFEVTLMDAVNRRGTGALNFTLSPCIVTGVPHKGATGKFADGEVMLMGYAPDGETDPLSFTVTV
jgi:hypothetical protein